MDLLIVYLITVLLNIILLILVRKSKTFADLAGVDTEDTFSRISRLILIPIVNIVSILVILYCIAFNLQEKIIKTVAKNNNHLK